MLFSQLLLLHCLYESVLVLLCLQLQQKVWEANSNGAQLAAQLAQLVSQPVPRSHTQTASKTIGACLGSKHTSAAHPKVLRSIMAACCAPLLDHVCGAVLDRGIMLASRVSLSGAVCSVHRYITPSCSVFSTSLTFQLHQQLP